MRIVFVSTSVGPLGSGIGGGVELTLRTLAGGLSKMGHSVTVVAPLGSVLTLSESNSASERSGIGAVRLMEVAGALHVPSQTRDRSAPLSVPANSVLQNMWHRVIELAGTERFDVVLNFAYDVLPFSEADAIGVPVTHLVSMGSLSDEMDLAVRSVMTIHPGCVAMHSRAQAETFGTDVASGVTIVGSGIDVERYEFSPHAGDDLAYVGRISREKGIEDVFAVSAASNRRVRAFGVMEDRAVWDAAARTFPGARVAHEGFLSTQDLQRQLGECAALLMVHRWVEAFGNVAIEAMACGVPVITYDRGGPAEIVQHGATGFVVAPDNVDAVVEAVGRLDTIPREQCRRRVLEHYSGRAFAGRVAAWLGSLARR